MPRPTDSGSGAKPPPRRGNSIGSLASGVRQVTRKPSRQPAPPVQRVAPSRSPVFGSLSGQTQQNLGRAPVRQAQRQTQRIQRKLPPAPARNPSLPGPKPARGTAFAPFQANEPLAPILRARTQANVGVAKGSGWSGGTTSQLSRIGAHLTKVAPTPKPQQSGGLLASLVPVVAAGHLVSGLAHGHLPSVGEALSTVPGVGFADRLLFNTGSAVAQHPGAVLGHTATGLGSIIAGTPAGLAEIATGTVSSHPLAPWERLLHSTGSDLSRRYGPLLSGNDKAFQQRITKEGIAPELLDATAVLGGATAATGRALGKVAREGSLGERAARIATERPGLRISGDTVVPQDVHPNLFRAYGQAGQDVLRERRLAGRNAKADVRGTGRPGLQPQGPGEVVPFSQRLANRAQVKAVSRTKALSYASNRREQQVELPKGAERDLAGLNHAQRHSIFHVMQGVVPIERKAGESTGGFLGRVHERIQARREQIISERAKAGLKPEGPKVLAASSELRTLDFLDQNAAKVFGDGKLVGFHAKNLDRSQRLSQLDPGLRNETALLHPYKVQGHTIGLDYKPPEGDTAAYDARYIQQVQEKAKALGLPEPAYFMHAKRFAPSFADRTASNVMRAVQGPKQSELKLFREGRAVTNPDLFVQGLAKNIKRRHQWKAVTDAADQHVFKNFGSGTVDQLKTRIEKQGLNLRDFAFYNPRLMKAAHSGADATASHDTQLIHQAFGHATVNPEDIAALPEAYRKTDGFVAIPRAVHDEIASSARPAGKPLRVIGKLQGIQSAAILGLSPSWLSMQVAANSLLTGLATHGNLKDLVAGPLWHGALPEGVLKRLDPATGIGAFEGHVGQPHLGVHQGRYSAAAERLGRTPIVQFRGKAVRVTDANPVHVMFRADNAQNNLFRRTVLYNGVKREAFKRMQSELGAAQTAQAKVSQLLRLKPGEQLDKQIRNVLANPHDVEKLATHVDNVLGDYLRYTSRERTAFRPFVMFYGFLRYALKTLFYTLPVHHPIAAALTAKIGQLHDEEIRKIFGTRDVPPWVMSRMFLYDGKGNVRRNQAGQIESIDLARINPVTTPLTDILQESAGHTNAQGQQVAGVNLAPALGMASPLLQAALDQAYAKNSFTGQGFHVHGSAEDNPAPDLGTRARIVLGNTLSSAFPYREAVKLLYRGKQGDDTLLGSPRPIHFKTAGTQAKEQQRLAALPSRGQQLLQDVSPLTFPRGDTTEQYIATHNKGAGGKHDPLAAKYGLKTGATVDDLAKKYGIKTGSTTSSLAAKYGVGG